MEFVWKVEVEGVPADVVYNLKGAKVGLSKLVRRSSCLDEL